MVLYKDLIFLNTDFKDKFEIFNFISNILIKKNFVVDNYFEELVIREKNFPTGLDLGFTSIAIPHCDAKNAYVDTLYFIRNNNSIIFENIEDGNDINTKLIIGIVISNPKNQVETLTKLISIFQNKELMYILENEKNIDKIYDILNINIK